MKLVIWCSQTFFDALMEKAESDFRSPSGEALFIISEKLVEEGFLSSKEEAIIKPEK